MANISQNVNIEMLEKLPDGTYKRKYPKTRADDGTTFDEHLADDETNAHNITNITGLQSALSSKEDILPTENKRKITFGISEPTGGEDGDIYFQYEQVDL